MPAPLHPTRTYDRAQGPSQVITLRLPPQTFTQSLTASLSFVGSFTRSRLFLKSFAATLFAPPSASPVVDDSNLPSPNNGHQLGSGGTGTQAAQPFTSNGGAIVSAMIGLYKNGATGNCVAKLYSTSSGVPITLLATSDLVDTSPMGTAVFFDQTFTFSGANQYNMAAGTVYAIALEYLNVASLYATFAAGSFGTQGASYVYTGSWVGGGATLRFTVYIVQSSSLATLIRRTGKGLTATFSPTTALNRRTAKSLTGTLSFIGATTKKYLDAGFTATLSFIGNLAASKTFLRALTATLSFTGVLSRRTGKVLSATLSFTAAQVKRIVDSGFAATLSFVGATTKNIRKNLTAALSFVGNLATSFIAGGGHVFTQSLTATLSFTGSLSNRTGKAFTATLSFIGVLAKAIRDAGFNATLSFVGFLATSKAFLKSLTATLSFTGAFSVSKSFLKAFTATLSFTGALSRRAGKAFSATLSTAASLVKRTARALSATLSFTSAIVKAIRDAGFTATLSFVGNLGTAAVHFFTRSFSATLSFVGTFSVGRRFARALSATLSFAGTIRRRVGKSLAATLGFSTTLRKAIRKTLAATLSFLVFFFKGGAVEIIAGLVTRCGALIGIGGSTARIAKAGSQLDVVERGSGAKIQVAGSTLRVERTK